MSAFDSVSKGLEEALAFAKGDLTGAKVHKVSVAEVDIAEVRQRTGLSQAEFAKSIEIGACLARPETDGMAVQLPEDPLRALRQTAGGRIEIDPRASGDLAMIVGDLCEQGRGSLRQIGIVLP